MSQKFEITKYVAEQEKLGLDEKSLRQLVAQWWQNPRKKAKGGLRLTDEGFSRLTKYFTGHRVKFTNEIEYTNQLILRLDNFINCPWYVTKREIWVFDDKMAVQLVLFSGNIEKFTTSKAKSLDNSAN